MGNAEIREPKQKRSIEKKRRIVEAGFKLFCEKGYYNTNTAEIAKEAGVSTGIVYNYFTDKKDIFLDAIRQYTDGLTKPMYAMMKEIHTPIDLTNLIHQLIAMFVKSHYITKSAHEEMMAMAHSDEAVREYFCEFEMNTAKKVVELMEGVGITPSNPNEKVHIAMGMIENLCHEIVYHQHDYMNYDTMTEEVVRAVVLMMSNES
ncbi:MAG: putative TetR family transcriptional regulator [Herbinix sp.]|jgi:AcrR family transcriptional regulator|nr:putative TetR family transcriptional regulator [Herbinix sp.]